MPARRRLTLAAVLPQYPPASRVGAWLATHGFLAHMAARGHRVKVTTYLGTQSEPYEHDGVTVLPRWVDPDQFHDGVDIAVSHLGDNGAAIAEATARGIPTVRMVHGDNPENLARLEAFPPALAVFNSHSLSKSVGWSGPSIVAHPPVDLDTVRTTPGKKVTLVNLTEAKGGRVFWELVAAMPHVQFLGVRGGYGKQVPGPKAKNATIIDPTVDMAGDVYAQTRILLMPSEHETWGMVGLEAMASGIPVIAHRTPGLVESLGTAALFVNRTDLLGWQEAIDSLLLPSVWKRRSPVVEAHAAKFNRTQQLNRFARAVEKVA